MRFSWKEGSSAKRVMLSNDFVTLSRNRIRSHPAPDVRKFPLAGLTVCN